MEQKKCQNCKQNFSIEPDDFVFYEKIKVPPPTRCPECRMIRRFVLRNHRNLFRRNDDLTGKEIFSGFPQSVSAKIYEVLYWNSDSWDPMEYGKDYDFNRPFFEQFRDFLHTVPWPSKSVINMVNSDYCNEASYCKNAYLCFDMDYGENSAYCVRGKEVKDSLDLYEARHSELCYEGYMVDETFRVFFSVNCEECTDVWFSRNLMGCTNCFGCVNLRNKSYYIFNEPYSKEQYQDFMSKFASGSFAVIEEEKKRAHDLWLRHPMRFTLGIKNVNSWGEHIEHSKNVQASFSIHHGENLKYCQIAADKVSDSYDYTVWGDGASQIYESLTCGLEIDGLRFCFDCWPSSQNLDYAVHCRSSLNLFGCVSLKKKQHCILNKQYSKEDYFTLRGKIIQHMNEKPYTDKQGREYRYGEFFPPEFSPFAYNETIAQDFFPLTKEEAEKKGYLWREPESREYVTTKQASDLPDTIADVGDDITKEIIACADCGKAYRVIPMELQFYRRIPLPLPRLCHNCRFKRRFAFVNPPKFWQARCMCEGENSRMPPHYDRSAIAMYQNGTQHAHGAEPCLNEFKTSYEPGRPEIIYCEECYQAEVV